MEEIKILVDEIRGMLSTMLLRIFYFPIPAKYLKIYKCCLFSVLVWYLVSHPMGRR